MQGILVALRDILNAGRILRAPLLIAIASAAVLAFPPQTLEVYRVVVQDLVYTVRTECDSVLWLAATGKCAAVQIAREPALSVLGLALLCVSLWFVARRLALTSAAPAGSLTYRRALAAAPLMLPAIVLLGTAWGVAHAVPADIKSLPELAHHRLLVHHTPEEITPANIRAMGIVIEQFTSYSWQLRVVAAILALAAVILIAAAIAKAWRTPAIPAEIASNESLDNESLYIVPRPWFTSFGLFALGALAFWLMPASLGRNLGTVAVFCLFATVLLLCLGLMTRLGDRIGLPLILSALVWSGLLSLAGLSNNHDVRTIGLVAAQQKRPPPPRLETEFLSWLDARKDQARYKLGADADRTPYPVYVVAAEGGGIYAAYHTARALAAFQDRCPAFGEHLFAISGVSGGSVGAAVFSSLKRASSATWTGDEPCRGGLLKTIFDKGGTFSAAAGHLFGNDLLSPLVGAMLFPDFAQRFIPWPIPALDRARALEYALEYAVAETLLDQATNDAGGVWKAAPNYMQAPYAGHWKLDGSAPALLFNATSVGTGERKVISPFAFGHGANQLVPAATGATTIDQLRLSTAAVISARFPWVTPSASVSDLDAENGGLRLVDGGYYDNSGIATATELKEAIETILDEKGLADRVSVKLIVLTAKLKDRPLSRALHEFMDPMRAFFGAWQRRAQQNVQHSSDMLARPPRNSRDVRLIHLQESAYAFPLGWRLSSGTLFLMDMADPVPGICTSALRADFKTLSLDADCALDRMIAELR